MLHHRPSGAWRIQLLTVTLSIYTLHVDLKYDAIGPHRPLLFFHSDQHPVLSYYLQMRRFSSVPRKMSQRVCAICVSRPLQNPG
jgi:hypothetical protein